MAKKAPLPGVEKQAQRQNEDHTTRRSPFKLDEEQVEYLSAQLGMPVKSGTIIHSHAVSAFERHTVTDMALRVAYRHAYTQTADRWIIDIGANPTRWKPSQKVAAEIATYASKVRIHGLAPTIQPDDVFRESDLEAIPELSYCACTFQDYTSGTCNHQGTIGRYGRMRAAPPDAHTFLSIHSLYYLPLDEVFKFLYKSSAAGTRSTTIVAVLHKFVGTSGTLCNGDLQWTRDLVDPQNVIVQVGKSKLAGRHVHNDLAVLFEYLGVGIPYNGGCICTHLDGVFGDTYCVQIRFARVQPIAISVPVLYHIGDVAGRLGTRTLYNVPLDDIIVRADERHAYLDIGKRTVQIPSDWVARSIDFCRYKARTASLFADLSRMITKIASDAHIDQGTRSLVTLHLPVIAFTAELGAEIDKLERAQLATLTRIRNRVIAYFESLCGENYTMAYHAALISWKDQPNHTPAAAGVLAVLLLLLYGAKRIFGTKPNTLDWSSQISNFTALVSHRFDMLRGFAVRVQGSSSIQTAVDFFRHATEAVQFLARDGESRLFFGVARQVRTLVVASFEELVKRCFRPTFSLVFGVFEAFGGNAVDYAYHTIMHYILRLMPLPIAIAFHTLHNIVHPTLSLTPMQWVVFGIACLAGCFLYVRRRRAARDRDMVREVTDRYLTEHKGTSLPEEFFPGSLELPVYSIDPSPPELEDILKTGSDPKAVPFSPRSSLSLAATGKIFAQNVKITDHKTSNEVKTIPVLKSEFATPTVLPIVPANNTPTLISALPRAQTRPTTDDDKKLVQEAPVDRWVGFPCAQSSEAPRSSSFTDWTSSHTAFGASTSPALWGSLRTASKWQVAPTAVVYQPLEGRRPVSGIWRSYSEFGAAVQRDTSYLVQNEVGMLPCYNIVCIASGQYHPLSECPEVVRITLPSAPASILSGWYWYSCDHHFMTACMQMIASIVPKASVSEVRPHFSPFTYLTGMRELLPQIAYPRIDGNDVNYDAWAARYTKSKRAALDAARHRMATAPTGTVIEYTTRCFVKREPLLWATDEGYLNKPPRMINGTSASYNVRFGPFFHALGDMLHRERGPCQMLLEGDYMPIIAAFQKGVSYKIFTTGDDCMIIFKVGDTYWVIMLDASRFDGTQNSRVFVLKLLFNLVCGMPTDMLNDYKYRPLRCRSFVGVDFDLDYQCLSGEPGTSVNNSAIMESLGLGIVSSLLSHPEKRPSEFEINQAVTFWSDAFQLNMTCEITKVDPADLSGSLPSVTHCSGWFLHCTMTDMKFQDIVEAKLASYDEFTCFLGPMQEPLKPRTHYAFSVLPGRFMAKGGFTLDAKENHDKIMLATMQSMAATIMHVPIVRVLVWKVIQRYRSLWKTDLVAEYGRLDEFGWRKVSSVISRVNGTTLFMFAKRYRCSEEEILKFERRLWDQPLPLMLGGSLIESIVKNDVL